MESISCTVDELAEALVTVLPVQVFASSPTHTAKEVASFLKADRIPEPVGTPIDQIEWWEE